MQLVNCVAGGLVQDEGDTAEGDRVDSGGSEDVGLARSRGSRVSYWTEMELHEQAKRRQVSVC